MGKKTELKMAASHVLWPETITVIRLEDFRERIILGII